MAFTTKQKVIGGTIAVAVLTTTGILVAKKLSKKVKVIKEVKQYKNNTVGSINVIETARQLGQDLGVAYSWYNPQNWTENDTAVRDTILQIPVSLMDQISVEYAKLYKRSLQADCQKLLPDSYYAQIRTKFL